METIRGTTAVASGAVSRADLRREFVAVHRDVFAQPGAVLDARAKARAAWQWSKGATALSGWSAAAVLGVSWVPDDAPAEVSRTHHVRAPDGIVVRKERFHDDELLRVDGMIVTSPARTAFDLGRRLRGDDAVIAIDAVCNVTATPVAAIRDVLRRHPGERGVRALRPVLDVADPGAESPWETRTRLAVLAAGLPRPQTQVPVYRRDGQLRYRLDLGWPDWLVGLEYDGAHHWLEPAQRRQDLIRGNVLARLGWTIIRVSAPEVLSGAFLRPLRAALRHAGAPLRPFGPL